MKSLFLLLFFLSSVVFAQSSNSIDTHMDNTDRRLTGINKLTPQEQQVLQEWINTHHTLKNPNAVTSTPITSTPTTSKTSYTGKGAVLSQNIAGGRYIILNDNSMWMINPEDTPTTGGWISAVMINVEGNPDSNWPYLLVNSVTDSKARARPVTTIPNIRSAQP